MTLCEKIVFSFHFTAPNTDNRWLRLSILMHHYGNLGALGINHRVFPPSNTPQLYQALINLLSRRPPRTFTPSEKEQMTPTNSTVTDTTGWDITLVHKIVRECLNINFSHNGNTFEHATGVTIKSNPLQMPSLVGCNSGDYLNLLKQLRNIVFHWPVSQMNEQDFEACWKLTTDVLNAIGINCSSLSELKYGTYLNSSYLHSFHCIMKESSKEVGKLFSLDFGPPFPTGRVL